MEVLQKQFTSLELFFLPPGRGGIAEYFVIRCGGKSDLESVFSQHQPESASA